MHLQIFPGGGNLLHTPYRAVYELLEELSARNGYTRAEASVWHAQPALGFSPPPPLNFPEALQVARSAILRLEESAQPYDILACSFGCTVAVALLAETNARYLRRLVLWGPVSYADYWRLFVRDLETQKKKASARRVAIDESFFPTLVPMEVFVPAVRVPTILARGTLDYFCPGPFLDYLRSLFSSHCLVETREVRGGGHEVGRGDGAEVLQAFEKAIFSKPRT